MRYDTVSPPEWTYGGGYLWLYDTALSNGPLSTRRTAEVLRISPATGRVLATVAVPSLPRVELAADEDGLWIARSQDTTWSGTKPPPLLSFVGARSTAPKVVIRSGDFVTWLVATGHTAWAAPVGAGTLGTPVAETFKTPSSKPHVVVLSSKTVEPVESGQQLFDANPVIADANVALFFATTSYTGSGNSSVAYQRISRFDPTNGQESKITSVRTPKGRLQAFVFYKGSLYLLIGGSAVDATLFRVPS